MCTDVDMGCEPGELTVRWWGPPLRNFDHLGRSLLTLFTVSTLDGFMEVCVCEGGGRGGRGGAAYMVVLQVGGRGVEGGGCG